METQHSPGALTSFYIQIITYGEGGGSWLAEKIFPSTHWIMGSAVSPDKLMSIFARYSISWSFHGNDHMGSSYFKENLHYSRFVGGRELTQYILYDTLQQWDCTHSHKRWRSSQNSHPLPVCSILQSLKETKHRAVDHHTMFWLQAARAGGFELVSMTHGCQCTCVTNGCAKHVAVHRESHLAAYLCNRSCASL